MVVVLAVNPNGNEAVAVAGYMEEPPLVIPSVEIKFAFVIVKFPGAVEGFVTTGMMSTEFKVVVDGNADIFVSQNPNAGRSRRDSNSFFIIAP